MWCRRLPALGGKHKECVNFSLPSNRDNRTRLSFSMTYSYRPGKLDLWALQPGRSLAIVLFD